jgi:hypothetical protein
MKIRFTLKAVAFLISGLFMLSACNKDQKLIADIEGEYKIESVINYRNGEGTPVIFSGGRIFFQDCTMKDGVGGNCEGWYEFEGSTKVAFQYNTRKEKGFNLIAITNLSSAGTPAILGSFKFKKDGGDLILDGIEQSGGADGVINTWYSDIRLSK